MIYPIYVYGSASLRKETEDITPDYPQLGQIIANMWETMYDADGVGLAAPQVGKPIRMFVIDARLYADEAPELKDFKKVFINPEIYEYSDEEELLGEGCLSLPNIREDVYRPTSIRIKYLDENFAEHDEQYDGFAARVIQHEYDHVEGKVFVDHLSALRKTLIKSKLLAMSKGKYKADYKTVLKK